MDAVTTQKSFADVEPMIQQTMHSACINHDTLRCILVSSWSNAAESIALKESICFNRHAQMLQFFKDAGLTVEDVQNTTGFGESLFNMMIHELVEGTPILYTDAHPFNLKDDELPLVLFGNTIYCKESTVRSSRGAYSGLSIPLGHGIRYNFGGYHSQPVVTTKLQQIDSGPLLMTTKHIYFGGQHKSIRLPYRKILNCVHYSDGIGLFRDTATAKLEVFAIPPKPHLVGNFLTCACRFLASPEGQALYSDYEIVADAYRLNGLSPIGA